jgi:uncharacterized protein (DUF1501 family)
MSESTDSCCEAYSQANGLTRRNLLRGAGIAAGAVAGGTAFGDAFRQVAYGATATGNVVVVLSLRGGLDGLGLVVPHGDPGYYAARPTIAIPRSTLLHRDQMFGLHPNLKPLEWMFAQGELAAVQAVGLPAPNRSHFSAMQEVEDADPTSSVRRGWVNRMIGLDADTSPTEAVHLTSSTPPAMFYGSEDTLAANRLDGLVLKGADPLLDEDLWRSRRMRQLDRIWSDVPGPLGHAGRSTLRGVRRLAPEIAEPTPAREGVTYPTSGLAAALKDTARLVRADIGAEVVSIDYGSWDLHAGYGTATAGSMQSLITGLAAGLDAFFRDLGPLRSRVTVVTISEFGRRVEENGSRGLDHGWGNAMLVAGGGVRGGRYYGRWPGLGGSLVEGDLAVTTDYRTVLGEIVAKRLDRAPSKVFPGLPYRPLGLVRS